MSEPVVAVLRRLITRVFRPGSPSPGGQDRGERSGSARSVVQFGGEPVDVGYQPRADGRPDPGEVVWTWVPFEEDASRGKDRPVLIVGRQRDQLIALMLTSKDHDRDAAQEAAHGRIWMDLGTGTWDRQGRPSEVRLDRVLRLDPTTVRREGAALDRHLFDTVIAKWGQTPGRH